MPRNLQKCRILFLMIKTNLRRIRSHKLTLLTAMIMPVAFSFVIMIVQFTLHIDNSDTDHSTLRPIQYELWWQKLVEKINKRRSEMISERSTFQSNVFIPKVILAYAPNSTTGIHQLVQQASRSLAMTPTQLISFRNCDELRLSADLENYIASVCFHNTDESQRGLPLKLDFSIIMPSELKLYEDSWIGDNWKTNYVYSTQPIGHIEIENGSLSSYVREGFISLQHYLSVEYLRIASGNAKIPEVLLHPYDLTRYANKLYIQGVDVSHIILLIAFMFPITFLTLEIVKERELEVHFSVQSNSAVARLQHAAWFLTGYFLLSIMCIIFILLQKWDWHGNLAIFKKCPLHIMIPFFAFYVLSAAGFSLLMAAILKSTQMVLTVLPVYWVFFTIPFFSNQSLGNTWTSNLLIVATILLCNVTMCRGLHRMMCLGEFTGNFHMKQYLLSTFKNKDPTLLKYAIMFTFQTILYVLLALFLDGNMCPCLLHKLSCAPCRKLLRKLRKLCRHRNSYENSDSMRPTEMKEEHIETVKLGDSKSENVSTNQQHKEVRDSKFFEFFQYRLEDKNDENKHGIEAGSKDIDADISKPIVIEFNNVWKKYNNNIFVVRQFSLKVHQNEIFVLLGHNGSGKSTIIKMLSGKLKPTMGQIFLSGLDVVRRPTKAYEDVGISKCNLQPYTEFTFGEHLFYNCRLRGLTTDQSMNDVDLYLGLIKVKNLKQKPVKFLTYGQKQILMVLSAFAGRTKVVILDRPMEGVDSQKRLLLIQLALLERNYRTIFIATNFPNVASYLGDRIGIMVNGRLHACGKEKTLLKMNKERYRLMCYLGRNCDFANVYDYFIKNIPNLKLESKMGDSVVFQIKFQYYENLMELLPQLAKKSNDLQLDSYYLITPNLEHILLHATQARQNARSLMFDTETLNALVTRIRNVDIDIPQTFQYLADFLYILSHIEVVFNKRLLMDKRSCILPLLQIFLPSLLCFWTLCMPQLHKGRASLQTNPFTMHYYRDSVVAMQQRATQQPLLVASGYYKESATGAGQRVMQLDPNDEIFNYMRRFISRNFLTNDLNLIVGVSFGDDFVAAYFNNNLMHAAPISLGLVMSALAVGLVNPNAEISVNLELLPYSTLHNVNMTNGVNRLGWTFIVMSCCGFCFVWTMPLLTFGLGRIWESPFKRLELIAGMHCITLSIANFIYDMIMVVISLMSFCIIILIFYSPLSMDSYYTYTYIYILLLAALCVHSIDVLISFWLTKVPVGFLVIVTVNILGIVIYVSTAGRKAKKSTEVLAFIFHPFYALVRNLMLQRDYSETFTVCADEQSYDTSVLVEHCEQEPNCCRNITQDYLLWNLTWNSYLTILVIWVFIYVRLSISKKPKSNYQSDARNPSSDPDSYNEQNVLHFTNRNHRKDMAVKEKMRVGTQEHPDVKAKALHVNNLCVYFDRHNVLNHINFLLERHQIISIAGCNGSGKTVLVKAIMGRIPLSAGNVTSYGVSSTEFKQLNNIKQISYCAQHINLNDALTVIEIVEIVLRIRGLKMNTASTEAEILLKTFELYHCRYHLLRECSIGIQKRVSVALSLLGFARLIILDEPFIYLDVSSRRKLCCIFETQCFHGKALLYTSSYPTHSNPANRTAIINSPGLYAIGERNELQLNAYATYIEVNSQISKRKFHKRLVQMEKGDALYERHINQLQICTIVEYYFPQSIIKFIGNRTVCFWLSSKAYSMSSILGLLHGNKHIFYSFEITQPSLESIFVGISETDKFDEDLQYYLYTT